MDEVYYHLTSEIRDEEIQWVLHVAIEDDVLHAVSFYNNLVAHFLGRDNEKAIIGASKMLAEALREIRCRFKKYAVVTKLRECSYISLLYLSYNFQSVHDPTFSLMNLFTDKSLFNVHLPFGCSTLKGYGLNTFCNLGITAQSDEITDTVYEPTKINVPKVHKVAMSNEHTIFLTCTGELFGCGVSSNFSPGLALDIIRKPTMILLPEHDRFIDPVVDIAVSNDHTVVRTHKFLYFIGDLRGFDNISAVQKLTQRCARMVHGITGECELYTTYHYTITVTDWKDVQIHRGGYMPFKKNTHSMPYFYDTKEIAVRYRNYYQKVEIMVTRNRVLWSVPDAPDKSARVMIMINGHQLGFFEGKKHEDWNFHAFDNGKVAVFIKQQCVAYGHLEFVKSTQETPTSNETPFCDLMLMAYLEDARGTEGTTKFFASPDGENFIVQIGEEKMQQQISPFTKPKGQQLGFHSPLMFQFKMFLRTRNMSDQYGAGQYTTKLREEFIKNIRRVTISEYMKPADESIIIQKLMLFIYMFKVKAADGIVYRRKEDSSLPIDKPAIFHEFEKKKQSRSSADIIATIHERMSKIEAMTKDSHIKWPMEFVDELCRNKAAKPSKMARACTDILKDLTGLDIEFPEICPQKLFYIRKVLWLIEQAAAATRQLHDFLLPNDPMSLGIMRTGGKFINWIVSSILGEKEEDNFQPSFRTMRHQSLYETRYEETKLISKLNISIDVSFNLLPSKLSVPTSHLIFQTLNKLYLLSQRLNKINDICKMVRTPAVISQHVSDAVYQYFFRQKGNHITFSPIRFRAVSSALRTYNIALLPFHNDGFSMSCEVQLDLKSFEDYYFGPNKANDICIIGRKGGDIVCDRRIVALHSRFLYSDYKEDLEMNEIKHKYSRKLSAEAVEKAIIGLYDITTLYKCETTELVDIILFYENYEMHEAKEDALDIIIESVESDNVHLLHKLYHKNKLSIEERIFDMRKDLVMCSLKSPFPSPSLQSLKRFCLNLPKRNIQPPVVISGQLKMSVDERLRFFLNHEDRIDNLRSSIKDYLAVPHSIDPGSFILRPNPEQTI